MPGPPPAVPPKWHVRPLPASYGERVSDVSSQTKTQDDCVFSDQALLAVSTVRHPGHVLVWHVSEIRPYLGQSPGDGTSPWYAADLAIAAWRVDIQDDVKKPDLQAALDKRTDGVEVDWPMAFSP